MAVTYTHSYSFVSIETQIPGQARILELHKPLRVNTHRHVYLTGFLFLGMMLNNCRKKKKSHKTVYLLLFLSC